MDLSNPPTGASFHCWKLWFRLVGFCLIFPNLEIALNQHSFHSFLLDRLFSSHFWSNLSCDFLFSYEKWFASFEPSSLNACRGTGAFPPRPLLKENQKNNNELKANEGDPQLEQGTRDLSLLPLVYIKRWVKSGQDWRNQRNRTFFFFIMRFLTTLKRFNGSIHSPSIVEKRVSNWRHKPLSFCLGTQKSLRLKLLLSQLPTQPICPRKVSNSLSENKAYPCQRED